jgi:hypothetical protein
MRVFWTGEDLAVWIGLALPSLLLGELAARAFPLAQSPSMLVGEFLFYLIWFILLKLLLQLKYSERFWPALGWVVPEKGMWLCLVAGPFLAVGLNLLAQSLKAPAADAPFQDLLFDRRLRILPLLAKWLGVAGGIVVTSAAFACGHGPQYKWMWQYLLMLTLAGTAFGWARWRYRSTMSAMVMHASFNLTVFLAHLYG